MSQHDQTTPIETFLDESDDPQRRAPDSTGGNDRHTDGATEADTAGRPAAGERTEPTDQASPYRGSTAVPEFRSGPAPTTTIVGLLGLLTTIALLVTQSTDLDIPWGVVGPVAVVGAGVLLVVLGLAGLRGQRFRG